MAGVEEEGEVAALREALRQQARNVEELRAELEEERQAAASGADEALAMILRLQAEKAAELQDPEIRAELDRRVREEGETVIKSGGGGTTLDAQERLAEGELDRSAAAAGHHIIPPPSGVPHVHTMCVSDYTRAGTCAFVVVAGQGARREG